MDSKVFATMDAAVADIPNGATIMVAGFGPGQPINLVPAVYRKGIKDITLIANSAWGIRGPDRQGAITCATLVEAGRVKKAIVSFTGASHPSQRSPMEELMRAGKLEVELAPQGTLAERIRAGGSGIPAFYTPTGAGTEIEHGKEHRIFDGRRYLLEHALTADYALIRAWKADTFGNLVFRRTQRNFNPIMAMAARCTIVEVEEPVAVEGTLEPDHIHTSGIYVHRLVVIPPPPEGILHEKFGGVW